MIQNRVKAKGFPDNIQDVVYQPGQFSPVWNGAFDMVRVSEATKAAVQKARDGADYSQGALYFIANYAQAGSWHEKTLRFLFSHGGHSFYR